MIFAKRKKQNSLGIDIGTKVIRAVEISENKGQITLENYGEVNLDVACKQFFRSFDRKNLNPAVNNISIAIAGIIEETGIKTKKVVFSLPDFATFFTTFELPPMSKKEIANAIGFEARKYIPLPLSELVLDWQLMNKESLKENNKVLVMAVPKIIVEQYKTIAEQSGLELTALEAEAMALKRAVIKENDPPTCLLEMGFQSTNINIIDNGFMKMSSSFDMAGKDLTYSLSQTLNIPAGEAEVKKKEEGLTDSGDTKLSHILTPILSIISERTRTVIRNFEEKEGKKVEKVILAGGTSLLPGLVDYLTKNLNQDESRTLVVEIAEPFKNIIYPKVLEKKMREINPNYAIALGEALRKFE
ncbi:MAG: type IV pilus assembly protein PilM [Candidatus Paceibacterota bacterium]|jgi:type IV pilus assembly protein PilM